VTGLEAVARARVLERRADALILDTYDAQTGRGGATGRTHDWTISRQIVDSVRLPVILAGGLTPDNVAEAIAHVRPWGVDVHTGVEGSGGKRDVAKIQAFIANAKSVQL
jgi:phosphoribosylanthranilate isomerase